MTLVPSHRARLLATAPKAVVAIIAAAALMAACTSCSSRAVASRRPSSTVAQSHGGSARAVTPPSTNAALAAGTVSGGAVLEQVDIPSTDGFKPRPAYLYLPPAAVRNPDLRLPVLELLHGTPDQPADWIDHGELIPTINSFAAAHGGEAPIVVMPDLNGTYRADSECIRTADGKDTESYLTGDVVTWIRAHFPRSVGQEKWWLAGMSEGGLCSLFLTLRHPQVYSAIGDFSGFAAPIVDGLSQAASDRQLYRGNSQDKLEHEPLWLLAHGHYAGLPAWFECGTDDHPTVIQQQAMVVAAARAAGLRVHVSTAPGTHNWSVWSVALRSLLPWLWSQR